MLCPPLLCIGGRARHTHFILAFLLFLLQWAEACVLSPPPSTSPLLFDEEDPLSKPEGHIVASSSEPTVGEFPAFLASNSEDVPQDGKSVKGNVKAPPQTPQSTSSSNPPTSDDARPYVFIPGKLFEVPEAYPKGAEGRLVNDKQFIRELEE